MYKFLLSLVLSTVLTNLSAQSNSFNITKLDSSENFYSKIQKEIIHKNIGVFADTTFSSDQLILQVIKYINFEANHSEKTIWTIIDKYEFNKNHKIEKSEHWITDNNSKMCKCGDWQFKTKGILTLRRPYPNCARKVFDCDLSGDVARIK